jgi:hypothetical protein
MPAACSCAPVVAVHAYAAALQHQHPLCITQILRLVCRHQHGAAARRQRLDAPVHHNTANGCVQCAQGVVHDGDVGVAVEHAGQSDARLLTAAHGDACNCAFGEGVRAGVRLQSWGAC